MSAIVPHYMLNLFFLKQASQIAALLRLALINTVSKKQLCFIETNQIKDVFLIIVVTSVPFTTKQL